VRVARGPATWAKRALLAVVLVGAAVIPGRATSQQDQHCTGVTCRIAGSVLWSEALPGSWIVQAGVSGTVTASDAAYAATGPGTDGVAAIGSGTEVTGYQERTGARLWRVSISGVPVGSTIVGVRAFHDVVVVGVEPPAGTKVDRYEVILSAAKGQQIRIYPAAAYGGAIQADAGYAVIVGTRTVTAYANDTGRVLWERSIGSATPTWRVSGQYVYVTEASSRDIGAPGVPALRQINLRTGAERLVRPPAGAFPGTLSGAVDGRVLFSRTDKVFAYDGQTGDPLWHKAGAVLELTDASQDVAYLAVGTSLTGVDIRTGHVVSRAAISVAASLYWVSDGVGLGLDQNALGEAWGYSLSARRVVWNSVALPWPHFFVDLSGLGGSASLTSDIVLLATCAQVGHAASSASAPACARPQLAAVRI
jgi:outer membrane protein assembly factor BamB